MGQGRPLLSISLLASNRQDTLRRCLDSLRPMMRELSCELIVVNTSTQPETEAIIREYTDAVIPFLWCNDFSKARNCGLAEARGEWYLYIDDDEWFEDTKAIVTFFQSGEYRHYGYANYVQRNFLDPEYKTYSDTWVSRMVQLSPEIQFRSKIHEYLYPVHGTGCNLNVIANHTGYIYSSDEDRKKRYERNVPLLREMMQEEPETLRWALQLAQEYYSVEKWMELEALCRESLQNPKYQKQALMKRLAATFYAGLAEALIGKGQIESALTEIAHALSSEDCSPLGAAYLKLQEGICYFEQKNWDNARGSIQSYFESEEKITADAAQYAIWQEALLVDSAFDMINQKKAYSVLLGCSLMQENTEAALRLFQRLEWEQSVVYVLPQLLPILLESTIGHPHPEYLQTIWRCIWNNKPLYDMMVTENRKKWSIRTPEQRALLREGYETQTIAFLSKYYQTAAIKKYPLLLPESGQRALKFMDEIEMGEEEWQKES